MSSPACKVTDIASLIPQRSPIQMVDRYIFEDELNCRSELTINEDNLFLDELGYMSVEGVLEHIAQTSAAHIGYLHRLAGKTISLGYIGDIKRCAVTGQMPAAGATLCTRVSVVSQVGNVTLVSAEAAVNDSPIMSCRMKVAED